MITIIDPIVNSILNLPTLKLKLSKIRQVEVSYHINSIRFNKFTLLFLTYTNILKWNFTLPQTSVMSLILFIFDDYRYLTIITVKRTKKHDT